MMMLLMLRMADNMVDGWTSCNNKRWLQWQCGFLHSDDAGTTVLESLWRLEEMLIESEYYWEAYHVDTWGRFGRFGRSVALPGHHRSHFTMVSRQKASKGIEICCFFSPLRDSGATITTRLWELEFFLFRQDVYGTVPASMAMMLANCISLAWVGASQMAFSLEMLQHGEYGDKEDHEFWLLIRWVAGSNT